jgi:DNA-directed RNA polymerase specialized sigma subunit
VVTLHKTETKVTAYKEENEKKKEYLWRYRESVRMVERIKSELEEIRAMRAGTAINYDGMPSGSGQSDLSDYAAELDKLERKLVSERYKRIALYQDIERRIKKLKDQKESDVLFYRYIKGLDWWEVAEKMGYSERQIHRLHGNSLVHLKLPEKKNKNVIEWQSNL